MATVVVLPCGDKHMILSGAMRYWVILKLPRSNDDNTTNEMKYQIFEIAVLRMSLSNRDIGVAVLDPRGSIIFSSLTFYQDLAIEYKEHLHPMRKMIKSTQHTTAPEWRWLPKEQEWFSSKADALWNFSIQQRDSEVDTCIVDDVYNV